MLGHHACSQGLGLQLPPWEELRSLIREAEVRPALPWGDDGWEILPQSEGPGGGGPPRPGW